MSGLFLGLFNDFQSEAHRTWSWTQVMGTVQYGTAMNSGLIVSSIRKWRLRIRRFVCFGNFLTNFYCCDDRKLLFQRQNGLEPMSVCPIHMINAFDSFEANFWVLARDSWHTSAVIVYREWEMAYICYMGSV